MVTALFKMAGGQVWCQHAAGGPQHAARGQQHGPGGLQHLRILAWLQHGPKRQGGKSGASTRLAASSICTLLRTLWRTLLNTLLTALPTILPMMVVRRVFSRVCNKVSGRVGQEGAAPRPPTLSPKVVYGGRAARGANTTPAAP